MAKVTFEKVNITYPNAAQPTVKDLDLEIADGEFLVLVGPSGCGKSTTLRSLAGLEPTSSGRILIDDKDVTGLEPGERDIAMVFQNYALYPHLSVAENMGFALKLAKLPKDEIKKKVDEAAATLGLTEYLDRKPKDLSGGQRQRIGLARALATNPSIIVLDEPVSALDVSIQAGIINLLHDLKNRLGISLVFVAHDLSVVRNLSDKVAVMYKGDFVEYGATDEVFDNPQHAYTKALLSAIPIPDPAVERNRKRVIYEEHAS